MDLPTVTFPNPNVTQPPSQPEPPPERRPVLQWHSKLHTNRDLLCLVATMKGWESRQDAGSLDEVELTQVEYEAAIAEAKALYQSIKATTPRALVLSHPVNLIAVCIRKPSKMEAENLIKIRDDDTIEAEETAMKFEADMVERLLFPKRDSVEMIRIMEETPLAFKYVFPRMMLEACGADKLGQVRKG